VSTQVLNERTFAPANVDKVTGGAAVTRTMSVGGTAVKAVALLVLTVAFAVVGWRNAAGVFSTSSGMLFLLGYILLIALTFAAVSNPRVAPVLGVLYAALMGSWMGAISRVYEAYYDGIVGQAVFASLCVFFACLILFSTGAVKVTGKFAAMVIGATAGALVLYLVAWILDLFGVELRFLSQPTPLGIGISVAICLVAALNLFLDFAVIRGGADSGAPKQMEWLAAFGLLSTLVWLYLEILRLLALLRGSQ
jgi:uncharacterized YccA/Bax inhibitor family protein